MASGTSTPASSSGSTGHHTGSAWKPSACGSDEKIHPCSLLTSARKK